MHKWLATFQADVFNTLIATVVVPSDRKAAVNCPIFNKGDPKGVTKYCPMRMNAVLCKFLKRIIL